MYTDVLKKLQGHLHICKFGIVNCVKLCTTPIRFLHVCVSLFLALSCQNLDKLSNWDTTGAAGKTPGLSRPKRDGWQLCIYYRYVASSLYSVAIVRRVLSGEWTNCMPTFTPSCPQINYCKVH